MRIVKHRAGGAPTHKDKPGTLPGPVEGANTSSKLGTPVEKPSSCHPPSCSQSQLTLGG